jgi:multidrug efflux pump subunit AcrA (membrane-fusion protein)
VLLVPPEAVRRDAAGRPYVFVIENGRAVKRSVVLGPTNETQAVVAGGLRPGDVVVAERDATVAAGTRVSPANPPPAAPSAAR